MGCCLPHVDNVVMLRLPMIPHLGRIHCNVETVAQVAEEGEPQMSPDMIIQAAMILHDVRTERTKAVTRVLHFLAWQVLLEFLCRHTEDGSRVQQSVQADHILLYHVRVRRTQWHALPLSPIMQNTLTIQVGAMLPEKVISPNATFAALACLRTLLFVFGSFSHDAIFLSMYPTPCIFSRTRSWANRLVMYDE